jgi:hypothetical protein
VGGPASPCCPTCSPQPLHASFSPGVIHACFSSRPPRRADFSLRPRPPRWPWSVHRTKRPPGLRQRPLSRQMVHRPVQTTAERPESADSGSSCRRQRLLGPPGGPATLESDHSERRASRCENRPCRDLAASAEIRTNPQRSARGEQRSATARSDQRAAPSDQRVSTSSGTERAIVSVTGQCRTAQSTRS